MSTSTEMLGMQDPMWVVLHVVPNNMQLSLFIVT
jgi:hypothetical protein